METVKIALIGAGSRSFGPTTVNDVLLSDTLHEKNVHLILMDKSEARVREVEAYSRRIADRLNRPTAIESTTDLTRALDGAHFVVTAIEVNRFLYWSQDFHVPRKYGFHQIFGENGGPGGAFHALRNMVPTVQIAREMERLCPDALLLNYTNPEQKLVEAVSRLTSIRALGLCHGVFMGQHQIARMLGRTVEELETVACGINHFTWFQVIRDKKTGEDLYPQLMQADREGDLLHDWHEIGLGRILFRIYGLWPSPAANHYGEYLRWAHEYHADQLQYFYDPAEGHPWQTGKVPEFVYSLSHNVTDRPLKPEAAENHDGELKDREPHSSGELAIPIMEALACGVNRHLDAVIVPNQGHIPNLMEKMVVEVPAEADGGGIHPATVEALPEGIAAILRTQGSIQQLLVEAFAEGSKNKLLQAILLEPTVNSYRGAVEMIDEMLALQKDLLPPLA
jgi:alpha-galactosidase